MAPKAQVGVELVTALTIILFILVLMTVYSIEKSEESNDLKTLIDAKRICTSVASNLDTIQQQGKGHYKYFTIPEKIYGNYEYNLSMGKNVVEISWGEKAWAIRTIASNVTIYCLDYGLNESNRVWNRGNYLEITCYRPNLRPIKDSIKYWNDSGNVTLSLKVENAGHVDSPSFNVSIDSIIKQINGLNAYEKVEVNQTIASFPVGGYTVIIKADAEDIIEESIESDNTINETITVTS